MNRRDAISRLAAGSVLAVLPFEKLAEAAPAVRAALQEGSFSTLDTRQAATVRELAEIILPRTETPGATDANVAEFIDVMLTSWMDPEETGFFLAGLGEVDERAAGAFGGTFLDGSATQRRELVEGMDAEVAELLSADGAIVAHEYIDVPDDLPEQRAPQTFYYQFRRLVLLGYFTSEAGMTEALRFNPFPGRWDPCVTVQDAQ